MLCQTLTVRFILFDRFNYYLLRKHSLCASVLSVFRLLSFQTEADILCKEDLDALKATHGDRFNLHYVVDKPEATPTTSTPVHGGYVSKELLMAVVPPPSTQQIVYVCGPPGFYNQ
jgi:NAD(P)H-flavin reductase